MRKTLAALSLIGGLAILPSLPGHAEEAASPHGITGNLGLFSRYRFRCIDQTFCKPALQGGINYAHSSGLFPVARNFDPLSAMTEPIHFLPTLAALAVPLAAVWLFIHLDKGKRK